MSWSTTSFGEAKAGESPTIMEYCEKHPELAEEIQELFPMVASLEDAKGDVTARRTTAEHHR